MKTEVSISEIKAAIMGRKKMLIVILLIAILLFGCIGIISKDKVNDGVKYCSSFSVYIDAPVIAYDISANSNSELNSSIFLSDFTIERTISELGLDISVKDLRDSIIAEESDNGQLLIINIIDDDEKHIQKISKTIMKFGMESIYNIRQAETKLIADRTEPETVKIEGDEKTGLYIVPCSKIEMSATYIALRVIKFMVCGLFVGCLLYLFIIFIKLFFRGE